MLTYAVFSDKGDRSYNEDSTYAVATENEGCFALADGLGGQGKGDVASKFVVEEVKKKYDQKRKKCLEKFITDMVSECQRDLMEVKGQEDITEDMMTTLVVLLVDDNQVSWGHVGDSRLYHFSDGKIVERTVFVKSLQQQEKLTSQKFAIIRIEIVCYERLACTIKQEY